MTELLDDLIAGLKWTCAGLAFANALALASAVWG